MTFELRSGDFASSNAPRRESREEGGDGLDALHRIVTGQALTRKELSFAGFFIATWFLMDVAQ